MRQPAKEQDLDPVSRLAVLAAALPGAVVARRRIPAPLADVWELVVDFEGWTPRYERGVAGVRVLERDGERLKLVVVLADGRAESMDVRLGAGWCLMQSPTTVVAFAARPEGAGTLLAHLEAARGDPSPGESPTHRARRRAKLGRELRTIQRLVSSRATDV
jgi:hypothetical protein